MHDHAGYVPEARHGIEHLLQTAGNDWNVRLVAGMTLRIDGMYEEALDQFNASLRMNPSNAPMVYNHRARVYQYQNQMELAADEITVSGLVMKKAVRGTSQDPRAATEEQWRVDVRMVEDGRRLTVHTSRERYEKLRPGDRVRVQYRKGKYTGTVWSAEIVD